MSKRRTVRWESQAAEDDYRAADRYLRLTFSGRDARRLVELLRDAPTSEFAAKDLLRASQTHLLEPKNDKVRATLKKIKKGEALPPVLLVRGNGGLGVTLTIADGHHRICASWHWDEKAAVACCLAALEAPRQKNEMICLSISRIS